MHIRVCWLLYALWKINNVHCSMLIFFSSSFFYMYWKNLAAKITEYIIIDVIINFLIIGPCFYLAVLYCSFSFTSYSGMKNFTRVISLYTWTLNQSFSSCREKFLLLAHLFLKNIISIRWHMSLPAPPLHLILQLAWEGQIQDDTKLTQWLMNLFLKKD